uniref:Adhesion G protein-coupled receptor D2 n=1 Tax=Cyprinodon variegatus TaxID=28743 RepID=A0A3Q2D663_CYPVA
MYPQTKTLSIISSVMCLFLCFPEQDKLLYQTSQWVLKLFNDSLPFSRAESFCRGQFSSLITLKELKENKETLEFLQQTGLHSPVWVKDYNRGASEALALSRQYMEFSALNFPKESHEGFARVNVSFPALSSVSVCVRVQWYTEWSDASTVFSYAAPVLNNEFQLRGQVDMKGHIHLALIIHGKHFPYKASFANDGAWHHICATWSRISNYWAIYVDGEKRDMGYGTDMDRDIHGDGIFILGQDQDSFGGNFTEPFFGNITDLNVWNISLESRHVRALNLCSTMIKEKFFSWNLSLIHNHDVVKEHLPEMSFWNFGCLFQSQPVQEPSGLETLAQASTLLNISVQALEDTQQEGLQPADMLTLIQLLVLTADVSSEPTVCAENSSCDNVQELSQHFISVADSIISEENADKWQAIKEVVHHVRNSFLKSELHVSMISKIQFYLVLLHVYVLYVLYNLCLSRPEAGGWWNTKGCEVVSKHYGYTVCYCNHTTNFALLLQVYETQRSAENEKALQVLTFIGCGVSLCGLLFTFILFIAVGVPKSDRTTVHKNLIIALGLAELLLMCSDWATENQVACFMVTALLHLSFMASFCWMLVEGLLLWSKVVSVNISEDRRMKLYYVIGWGLPVLIVGLTLVISGEKYKAHDHCWLSVKTDTIWAFVGPVIFVLTVNAVVLCRVVMVTISSAHRRAKMLSPSFASKMQTFDLTWAVTRPVLILLPVLGLTWICGVLVHLSVVLSYIFIILNSLQGLYIFIVYAVYNSEVRWHSCILLELLLDQQHIIKMRCFVQCV